jgi:hypothetical protein
MTLSRLQHRSVILPQPLEVTLPASCTRLARARRTVPSTTPEYGDMSGLFGDRPHSDSCSAVRVSCKDTIFS